VTPVTHLFRFASGPTSARPLNNGLRPHSMWPSRFYKKIPQAVDQGFSRSLSCLTELLQYIIEHTITTGPETEMRGKAVILTALGKYQPEMFPPTVDSRPPGSAESFDPLQGNIRISSLTKGCDQKQHRCPVHPTSPEPDRRRFSAAAASLITAAQAETNFKNFLKICRSTPWLSLIICIVQRTSAKRATPGPGLFCHIQINFVKKCE
jgi:hypothetical protein